MRRVFWLVCCIFVSIGKVLADDTHSTVITSKHIEMNDNDDDGIYIVFTNDVHVIGTTLDLSADKLEVLAKKSGTEFGCNHFSMEKLRAIGDVRFVQTDRSGRANEIVVLPKEEVMYLIGHAEITDKDGTVRGDRLLLDKNSRSVKINSKGRSVVSIPQGEDSTNALFKPKQKKVKVNTNSTGNSDKPEEKK